MDPKIIGVGPAPATRRAMLKIEDIDLVEASEAVAAQSIAVARELGFDERQRRCLLHRPPYGRLRRTSSSHEIQKRPEAKKGLSALCIGGGMGVAAIFEKC